MIRDWPGLILRLAAARGWDGQICPHVFVLGGPHESRVTIVAQQARATNLAWALHRCGRLGGRVGVVGAGAAGATFASAAALLGADVTLFDEHEEPITTQRWTFDRYLHPNLYDWPVDGWDDPTANLPVVAWSAGPSATARLEMVADFSLAASFGGLKWCSQHSVSEVRPDGNKVELSVCDLRSASSPEVRVALESFDLVVVATGFLPEPRVAQTSVSGSYWQDWDIEGVLESAEADHTIVGDGDGALTELVRLKFEGWARLGSFHQSTMVRVAADLLRHPGLGADALAIESGASATRGGSTLRDYSHERFAGADGNLPSLRSDPHRVEVRAGRVTSRRNAFAINRYLAARLTHLGAARFVLGEPLVDVDVGALAPSSVIWRTGSRRRRRSELVRPALSMRDAGDALAAEPAHQDVLGTVDDLMDASREPRWDVSADFAGRASGSALSAAGDIEWSGLAASAGFGWTASVWPGLVDDPPMTPVTHQVLDLAYLAGVIGNCERPLTWSNFRVTPDGAVELSLDLVAAAASLTPTEVIDQLRRHPASGVRLAVVNVERGRNVQRLWVRVDTDAIEVADPTWTLVSLLLAPGFAEGDSAHDGPDVGFEWHEQPQVDDDDDLDNVVRRVLDERKVVMASAITDAGAQGRAVEAAYAAAPDARSVRTFLTLLHRRLGGADDLEFREALLQLAKHVETSDTTSPLVERYLRKVLRLESGDRPAALLRAAFGPLFRREASSGRLEPMTRFDERLHKDLPDGWTVPETAQAPDLTAFAVYIDPSKGEAQS